MPNKALEAHLATLETWIFESELHVLPRVRVRAAVHETLHDLHMRKIKDC